MSPELKKEIESFRINRCGVSTTGIDGVHEILPMIHGIASLLDMGFRQESDGSSALGNASPELVAAAFDGIAHLAAMAMLAADEI